MGIINYICSRKHLPARKKAARWRKSGPQDSTIAQYVNDVSFVLVGIRGAQLNQLRRLIDCLLRIDSQSRGELSNRLIAQ